jgi:hypothetical protein
MNQHLTVAIWDGEQAVATLADAETWDQDQEWPEGGGLFTPETWRAYACNNLLFDGPNSRKWNEIWIFEARSFEDSLVLGLNRQPRHGHRNRLVLGNFVQKFH